jgi:hypothetical protein
MSEKRRRKEQRRQRRKAKSASRAQARNSPERILAQVARLAVASVGEISTALEAEVWASSLFADWQAHALPGEDPDATLFPALAQAFEAIGTAPALAALRALASVGTPTGAARAGAAADRLAQTGLPEPEWGAGLGAARPTAAVLIEEPEYDDGVTVMVEFDGAHGIGVYIDHNLGGLVKDAFLTDTRDEFCADLPDGFVIRELSPAEARARVAVALDVLDHTLEPPVREDVWMLRALVEARLRLLPDGFPRAPEAAQVAPAEREALLAEFLAAPEGARWKADEDAEFVIRHAIDFGADDNHGGPLRWSPGVVEIFMADWLPGKVVAEPELFARVPDVLPDWVRYAGRRRNVAADSLAEAVAAVEDYREDLLNAATDPDTWSLANAIAEAALEAGVDPTDDAALARFMREREP